MSHQPSTQALIEQANNWLRHEKRGLFPAEFIIRDLVALLSAQAAQYQQMHRRAQAAEAGVQITIDQCRREGVSLGRTLAHAGYRMLEERAERAEAEIARVYPEDGFWSVEVREGQIVAVIKLVQPLEDVTR